MGLFRKKTDPITERARTLTSEIAAIEAQIKQLNSRVHNRQSQGEERSIFESASRSRFGSSQSAPNSGSNRDPIFESVDQHRMNDSTGSENTFAAAADLNTESNFFERRWRGLTSYFRKPPTSNPKLVSYLAAGSIKGLRPLRYEKRVARNRTIALSFILILLLWGVYAAFVRQN